MTEVFAQASQSSPRALWARMPFAAKFFVCLTFVNLSYRLLSGVIFPEDQSKLHHEYSAPLWDAIPSPVQVVMIARISTSINLDQLKISENRVNALLDDVPMYGTIAMVKWQLPFSWQPWHIFSDINEETLQLNLPHSFLSHFRDEQNDQSKTPSLYLHLETIPLDASGSPIVAFSTRDRVELITWIEELLPSEHHLSSRDLDSGSDTPSKIVPYLKDRIDCRVINMTGPMPVRELVLDTFRQRMPAGLLPARPDPVQMLPGHELQSLHSQYGKNHAGFYAPITWANDFWNVEYNHHRLDILEQGEDLEDNLIIQMTLSSGVQSVWGFMGIQSVKNLFERKTKKDLGSVDLSAFIHEMKQGEMMVFKKMFINRSPGYLVFSAIFMTFHSIFSFLAVKNEVSFWRNNQSLIGISAYTLVINFISELIIGLYIFDSEGASKMIVIEVFIGVALSLWKLYKNVESTSMSRRNPYFLGITFKKGFEDDSETKQHDLYAMQIMAAAMSPLVLGYGLYSYGYRSHKSMYSFVLDWAAGFVYTFGFIAMVPQLYINYQLKSVDHLPARAMIYKSLNTFVDDVASLLIEMPLLHRLSCFRDDIIFIIYLYQRWIYRVDKKRNGEFWKGEDDGDNLIVQGQKNEAIEMRKDDKSKTDGTLRQRWVVQEADSQGE